MASRKKSKTRVVSVARARFQPVSARKVRFVAEMVQGKTVSEAQAMLSLVHRPSSAPIVERLLKSAAANSQRPDSEDLVVGRIWADSGPTIKRWRPRAYGRGAQIRKRMSHITIQLTEQVGTEEA